MIDVESVFIELTRALSGSAGIALAASLAWGVLSIVLSPCHLASIPLVVGWLNDGSAVSVRRALPLSALFALGILVTIAVMGAATAAAGRLLGDLGAWGDVVVAVVFLGIGGHLLGLYPLPLPRAAAPSGGRRGAGGAFVLGLVFGAALGPCTFAFLAPVLGVVLETGVERPAYAVGLTLAFALGHCLVIAAAGASVQAAQGVLNWHERSGGAKTLRRICGLLVIAAGVYLLWR